MAVQILNWAAVIWNGFVRASGSVAMATFLAAAALILGERIWYHTGRKKSGGGI